jgi:hypothetical protein
MLQAVVLLLFNDVDDRQRLSYQEIAKRTKMGKSSCIIPYVFMLNAYDSQNLEN